MKLARCLHRCLYNNVLDIVFGFVELEVSWAETRDAWFKFPERPFISGSMSTLEIRMYLLEPSDLPNVFQRSSVPHLTRQSVFKNP